MQRLEQSFIVTREVRDPQHESILAQIEALDRQNKKLVSIADNILKTSFLRPVDQKPTIILQFEEDMRGSFNALIESIREFFISVDEKVEHLATILQANFEQADLEKSRQPYKRHQGDADKIDTLISRMNLLQQNLKKTQQNENRLINIIESMTSKKNLADEQPTMVRSREKGFIHPTRPQPSNGTHQTSFRLFSVHGNSANSLQTDQYGTPSPAYHMISSQFSEKQKQLDRQPTYRFNNFCMPVQEDSKQKPSQNFLINRKAFQMENSNRIHRLSALMKALKE